MATWITKGELAAASDPTTSDLINTAGTASQSAVDSRVAAVAPGIVAAAPTVVAAAASAVATQLAEEDVLVGGAGDPRVAIRDDGAPYTLQLGDSLGRWSDLAIDPVTNQLAEFVLDRLAPRLASRMAIPVIDSTPTLDAPWSPGVAFRPARSRLSRLAGWGSSSMLGLSTALTAAAVERDATYFNGGVGGQVSVDIAARQGVRPYVLAAATVPTSGSVNVTLTGIPVLSRTIGFTGTVSGMHGTLAKATGTGAPVTFTPTTSPTVATPISGAFIPDANAERDAVTLLNVCKNDLAQNVGWWLTVEECVQLTHDMVRHLVAAEKRVLILTHYFDTNTPASSTARDRIAQYNAAIVAAYGAAVVRFDQYVASSAIYTDLGITPTTDDTTQMGLGNKGPSISSDDLHLTPAASAAVVQNLIEPKLDAMFYGGA